MDGYARRGRAGTLFPQRKAQLRVRARSCKSWSDGGKQRSIDPVESCARLIGTEKNTGALTAPRWQVQSPAWVGSFAI
jgi:hypothetical protein